MKKTITILLLFLAMLSSHAQYTAIPDPNFEQALYDQGLDDIADGQVLTANISSLFQLSVGGYNIQSLIGIEDFISLEYLFCPNNQLTSLNLTNLTNLYELDCSQNQFASLDLTGVPSLFEVKCDNNQLTSLIVSGMPVLYRLNCDNNQLSSIDLSGLNQLHEFSIQNNQLLSININVVTNLRRFDCSGNQIASLNLSGSSNLSYLACNNNELTTLNLSGVNLSQLSCNNNQLTSLNVSTMPNLLLLSCNWNQITALDLSSSSLLYYLECGNNLLTSLNVNGLTRLRTFYCNYNLLSALDLNGLINLRYFYCRSNQLTSLNLTSLINLSHLHCDLNNCLNCILVNNVAAAYANSLWIKDGFASYSSVNCPNITPTFTAVAPICFGETLLPLPTTSIEGITGTWSPALNNLATTTYTFAPIAGQCAPASSLTVTVNPSVVPTFTAVAPICSGETLLPLPTISLEGIAGTWSPALNNLATTTYTFTPATGQCATTTTLTIAVNSSITPTFTAIAPICSGETLLPLPTTSLNGIDGSWWPVLNNTATTTYTFRPKPDQCAAEITVTITVNSPAIPTFTAVVPICSGEMLAALPTTSTNGITGTWSPALNNWATTTYTFTPTTGQCATSTTMTIVVTPVVLPNFAPVSPICAGSILTALPTTSTNGISGTWSPALNNTTTTFYIFTPTAGQCAKKVELLIKVLPNKSPNFNPVPPICLGKTLAPLPTTSLDGYTGTWSPALNNTVTTTYTFTPTVGQCAVPVTMTIVVDPPTLGGVVSGGTTICRSSTSGVLTLSGHVGIIVRWESSTNNFVTKTNINNNTTTHISGPLTTTTQFRAVIQGICGEGFSTSTTVTPVVVLSPAALRLTDNAISPLTAITDVSRYIGTSVPLTLTATTVSGATSYEWEFPAGVNQLSGGTSNTVTIDFAGVGPGATSLYLGAKARNGDCISTRNNSTLIPATFSTARLLRVSANIPATPSALKLTDDAISTSLGINNVSRYIGTTVPLTLTANVSVNANSYDWELPAGVTQLSGGNTNIISVNFAGVGAGVTSLYLGAVARNGVGVSIRNNSSLVPVTTSTARLLKVTASVPSTVSSVTGQFVGICGGNTYNYAITPSVLATSYIITAPAGSIVTSLSNPLNVTNTLSTTDLMFSVLYPTNLASVAPRTIVINAVNGVGSNLTNRTLNISTTLPSIGIATGSEGTTTFQRCNTQTFTVPAVVGATSYLWEVINGAAIVGASNTNTVEVDFSLVPIFSTTNLVKVRAVNACGIFSNVRNITLSSIPCTVLRGATKEIKNTYNDGPIMGMANMYPNPTSGAFKLDLEMLAEGQVDIEIYASNAGVIKTNKGVHLEKGTNTIEMDISNLAIGVYMVRITNTATDEVLVKRIIKE